jgi:hypothetical protein
MAIGFAGCRVVELGESVAKNQKDIAESILYTDSLFTNDGQSRLSKEVE